MAEGPNHNDVNWVPVNYDARIPRIGRIGLLQVPLAHRTGHMRTPLQVLLVECSEHNMETLSTALTQGGYEPTFDAVGTPSAMATALADTKWDLIISDYTLSGFTPIEALDVLKRSESDTPFIVVSDCASPQSTVETMRAGAHDWVTKRNLPGLAASVRREIHDARLRRQRRVAARATQESEAKYRTLFEQSGDAMYITDEQGRFIGANQAAIDLFGYSRTELMNLHGTDLCVDEDDWRDFVEETQQQGSTRDYCARMVGKDGAEILCLLSATLRSSADGGILGYHGIVRDITQRRRLEQRMRQRDRMAALGGLAGGIAHDFNNALMSITLCAEMLLADPGLPSRLRHDVKSIFDQAKDSAYLVRQILDFSRHAAIETRILDLKPFLTRRMDMLQRTLPASIRLILEVWPGEFTAQVDPTRIQQALMNLVVNARDAMQQGGELRIGLSRFDITAGDKPPVPEMSPGRWIRLTVADTGTGIPTELIPRVFEPFLTTKPEGQGTGLGLAQVYGIVKQHGGHIGLESVVAKGSTFTIYLPFHDVPQDPPKKTDQATPTGNGETVLVVEDERSVRQSCRRILESLGYQVSTACNGKEALAATRAEGGFDLVLTDMVMPVMSGKDLIRELRRASPPPRILAMTGYVLADELRELKAEGALGTIHKPLDVKTLARSVRAALDGLDPHSGR